VEPGIDLFSLPWRLSVILFVFHALGANLFAFELIQLNQEVIHILKVFYLVDLLEFVY
jgi:hypothetical protein